ncbi:FliC/FljB family flagellin [Achromobacter denitrificans]|uniref:Flagellin n=1 Tax=Achromobacter denitrificans TaxID=32002 RepID=A0ABZ3G910_ACHDE
MAAVINTNYLSLVAQNNLNKSQSSLGTAIERLSSGLRINSAKDDAAGQAIANRFTANINGLTQAARNANDGISIAQTTEGALNEINNNLQRIRQLTTQAVNGTNSDSDLKSIQDEINQRLGEIDRVSGQTQFNGVKVLASDDKMVIQVGANDGETITINLQEITSSTLGLTGFNVDGSSVLDNRAAKASDLPATGVTKTGNEYAVETANSKLTAADTFSRLQDTNQVIITGGANANTYTYDAASGKFKYASTSTAATADAAGLTGLSQDIATEIGNSTKLTVTFGGTQTDVTVDATGKLTASNGDELFIEGGQLTAAPIGTGPFAQASLEDLTELAASTAGAKITTADGVTYQTTTAHDNAGPTAGVVSKSGATISKEDLLAIMTAGTAGVSSSVTYGDGVTSATIALDQNGVATGNFYKDANGTFTTQDKSTVTYTEDSEGNLSLNGKAVYVDDKNALTTEATRPGTKTADPLAGLDKALAQVDSLRSQLGAVQNRFESTITNLNNTVNNLSAARSRIEDADYATEVSNMTRAQILQQAGTSVLAQANQVPQTVLSLLR